MSREALLEVLRETRALLARPDNDFTWSSWDDQADALAEMDRIVARIVGGGDPDMSSVQVLFLPTGDLQEVSISSGWGDQFLTLAGRCDRAIRRP